MNPYEDDRAMNFGSTCLLSQKCLLGMCALGLLLHGLALRAEPLSPSLSTNPTTASGIFSLLTPTAYPEEVSTTATAKSSLRDDLHSFLKSDLYDASSVSLEHAASVRTTIAQTAWRPGAGFTETRAEVNWQGQFGAVEQASMGALLRVQSHQMQGMRADMEMATMAGRPTKAELSGGLQLGYAGESNHWAVGGVWMAHWQPDASQPSAFASEGDKPPPASGGLMPPPPSAQAVPAGIAPASLGWTQQYFGEVQLTSNTRMRATVTASTPAIPDTGVVLISRLSLQHALSRLLTFTARLESSAAGGLVSTAQSTASTGYLLNLNYQLSQWSSMAVELSNLAGANGSGANPTLSTMVSLRF